ETHEPDGAVAPFIEAVEGNQGSNQATQITGVGRVFAVRHPTPLHRLLEVTMSVMRKAETVVIGEQPLIVGREAQPMLGVFHRLSPAPNIGQCSACQDPGERTVWTGR